MKERVAPLPPDERDERQAELVRYAGSEFGVYTTLVRHPDLFADFMVLGRRLLRQSSLEPRDREMLILRTAYRCRARYEWSHHDVLGRRAGLTDFVGIFDFGGLPEPMVIESLRRWSRAFGSSPVGETPPRIATARAA